MEDIKKGKEISGVWCLLTCSLFYPQNCVLLFWFHAGNGSRVYQRLKLHRGSRNSERQRKIRSEYEKAEMINIRVIFLNKKSNK